MMFEMLQFAAEYILLSPTLLLGSLWLLGLLMGSFFLVVVDRSQASYQEITDSKSEKNSLVDACSPGASQSWVSGRSRCDHCAHLLRWYHNLPIISYVWLRGRCHDCHQLIDRRYPLTELATGLIYLLAGYLFLHNSLQLIGSVGFRLIFYLVLMSVGWLIWLFDRRYVVIPDLLVGLMELLALGRCLSLILSGQNNTCWLDLAIALGAALLFWLCRMVPLWLTGHEGMGWGDIKLVAPLALLLGYPLSLVAVFCAFIIGGVWGIILLITQKANLKQRVSFGPFLVLGSWIALVWGSGWWLWYWGLLG